MKYRYLESFATGGEEGKRGKGAVQSPKKVKTRHFGTMLMHRIAKVKYVTKEENGRKWVEEKVGEVGGWIESMSNLSQSGECWVGGEAKVCGEACVSGDAEIGGEAEIGEKAIVKDKGKVGGKAAIGGRGVICGEGNVDGGDRMAVSGRARVLGRVSGDARVSGAARVMDGAVVAGKSRVGGRSIVYGEVGGEVLASSQVVICGTVLDEAYVVGDAIVSEEANLSGEVLLEGGVLLGGAEVSDEAVVGSEMFEREWALFRERRHKEDRAKDWSATAEEFGKFTEIAKRLYQVSWEREDVSPEGSDRSSRDYDEQMFQEDEYSLEVSDWWKRLEPYEGNEEFAAKHGLAPDRDGKIEVPCWYDVDGERHPIDVDMAWLRGQMFATSYGRIGGGAGALITGEVSENGMVIGPVMMDGEVSGLNYVVGATRIAEKGVVGGQMNVFSGYLAEKGKIDGEMTSTRDTVMFGVIRGKQYPHVSVEGLAESSVRVCFIGEEGRLLGKFALANDLIEGLVAGVQEFTDSAGRMYLGVDGKETYILNSEQGVLFEERLELSGSEEGEEYIYVRNSLPSSAVGRFIEEERTGLGPTDTNDIGYFGTFDEIMRYLELKEKDKEDSRLISEYLKAKKGG